MTCLSKIKLLVATVVTACALALPLAGEAWAGIDTYDCFNPKYRNLPKAQVNKADNQATKNIKAQYHNLTKALDELCKTADDNHVEFGWTSQKNLEEDIKADGKWNVYQAKLKQLDNIVKQINALQATDSACGESYPYGCYNNQKCFKCEKRIGGNENDLAILTEYKCSTKNPCGFGSMSTEVENSGGAGSNLIQQAGTVAAAIDTNANGETVSGHIGLSSENKSLNDLWNPSDEAYEENARSNAGFCDINALKSDYMSNCYSCVVVGNLIKTFMSISAITYPVAQKAGVKLLVIGMMIWLAFYVLKNLSSFVSLEPMNMLQELFSFFFKCLIAYVLMTSGLRNITDLIVDPILKAGADYGIGIIDSVSSDLLKDTEIEERTKKDNYSGYQAEAVKDKAQAEQVEKDNNVKVKGEVNTSKYRPEDISKTKESGMDYCCWGDKKKNGYHAFGAHQLDFFSGGAEEFAISCKNTNQEIYKAYEAAGKKSGTALRSALTPIFERMCSTASGKAELKKLQDDYYVSKYKSILSYASKQLGITLNLSNYAQDSNFTLSAALISGQIHNPKAIRNIIDSIATKSGSCASRSCNMDAIAQQVYAGLKQELGFTERYGTGKDSEFDLCQRVLSGGDIDSSGLSSSGSSGYASYDYRQTDHYYVVEKGDQEFDLIPISKEDNKAVLNTTVFDKIMLISRKADNAVSLNFVIGDALVCHSTHAGAIQFAKKVTDLVGLEFYFPDVWIWLCGAVIWVFALMVTLAVNFYLLDLSFKIGFALLALPITIGLWPFEKFKDKFKVCVDIIINAAGTFMFLGITTGLSVVLISTSLGGTEELFNAIENDRKEYISNTFSLTGAKFFLILFAFLYSHKMISGTVSKLADKFFPSVTNGLTPMHHMTTQAIDMGVSAVKTVASGVAGAVTGGATTAAKAVAKTAVRQAVKGIRKGISKGGSGVKKMLGGK